MLLTFKSRFTKRFKKSLLEETMQSSLLIIFTLIAGTLGRRKILPGTLTISQIGSYLVNWDLGTDGRHLIVSSSPATFSYGNTGTLKDHETGEYLTVNGEGKLVLDPNLSIGFRLKSKKIWGNQRQFMYDGWPLFELCPDNSIGFNSNCEGGRQIAIVYEDILPPKTDPWKIET